MVVVRFWKGLGKDHTLSHTHTFCCLFQHQHEKSDFSDQKIISSHVFAVQITTFLYRRQRWKSFDVAIVQKNEVRVSINHGPDLSLDAPGVVVCTLCPGVGLLIWWGSNDTLDVSSQNSTGQERENVLTETCQETNPIFPETFTKKKIIINC